MQQLLASYTAALKVAHIVEGHAPKEAQFPDGEVREQGQMFQWKGLLFLIDVGMSSGVRLQFRRRPAHSEQEWTNGQRDLLQRSDDTTLG